MRISASFSLSFCLSSKISGGTDEEEDEVLDLFLSAIVALGKKLRTTTVGVEVTDDSELDHSVDLPAWDEVIPPGFGARSGVWFGWIRSLRTASAPTPSVSLNTLCEVVQSSLEGSFVSVCSEALLLMMGRPAALAEAIVCNLSRVKLLRVSPSLSSLEIETST